MILLGQRHTLNDLERETLLESFPSIDTISYTDQPTQTTIDQIDTLITHNPKSLIVLNTFTRIPDGLLSYLVRLEAHGITYIGIERFLERYLYKCYIPEDQTDITFLEDIKPYPWYTLTLKWLIDVGAVLFLGIITSPVALYTVWKIRRQSPGSILFRQERTGRKGETFTCYKFRSMHENSHHDPYTQEDDPRIFPWGHTMRKTRIDELPQLWNVLRGDMHLLGPRAEWNILVENYEKEIPYYHARHVVRPGITGWAQVNYPYGANADDARQKLMYDLYYIKYWTPWLEIKTAWKTIGVMLGKKGR